jgi:ATP-dependent Clp protease protease subunit
LPHSRTMIHHPSGCSLGMQSDIEIQYKEITHMKKMLTDLYVKHNTKGKTYADFERDMDRDNFMTAQEAVDYGLADQVIEKR